ncbi:alpha/beta fold hydrolase [Streptomyces sp. GC420]|uniref:alpha/beta fold hydrolase n=1 Tax=Streptomyces sp. GC420 TaxID=2697568 RepID=UPI00141516CE|nr:alpha/beta hydrolase [Streptomyces sp. GC420]NBM20267.1 alpha/beta fold hydrolase [Streptomyces sp. GC420]
MQSVHTDVRAITLDAGGHLLSALVSTPAGVPPRAVVVAVHGGGMRAGYFHGPAHPDLSLLSLGPRLGYAVLAVDRPGYGLSAERLPQGQRVADQAATLHAALAHFAAHHDTGAGFFLLAHSYGGKIALRAAAENPGTTLIGLDISGCGHRYAVDPGLLTDPDERRPLSHLNWGPLRLYPPGTFRLAGGLLAPRPELEVREAPEWPTAFPGVAADVRAPVRLTFAEHEGWWRHDNQAVTELTELLSGTQVTLDRLPNAGHNISLGWAARTYHLRALAFLEQLLLARDTRGVGAAESAAEVPAGPPHEVTPSLN